MMPSNEAVIDVKEGHIKRFPAKRPPYPMPQPAIVPFYPFLVLFISPLSFSECPKSCPNPPPPLSGHNLFPAALSVPSTFLPFSGLVISPVSR
jgi:hypothetical protein